MTVESTTSKIIYTGDGVTTVFPYDFKIFADGDLVVTEVTIATQESSVKTLNTDYTVSGAGNATGGNVTMTTAPASTVQLVIQRELDLVQELDLVENDAAPAGSREDALDKIVMMLQQHEEKLGRAFLRQITQTGEIITDIDATWYYLRGIDLSNAILFGNLDLGGYKIYDIKGIWDSDEDTGVQVEETADEDKIRFDTAGSQRALIDSDGLTLGSGASVNEFSTDGTLSGNSDDAVPTEKAVKTYADAITATGAAGGDLGGTYPNPTVDAQIKKAIFFQPDSTCILAFDNAEAGVDLSVLHNAITLTGLTAADLVDGKVVPLGYRMDGSNDYATIAHHAKQAGMTALTIEVFMYLDSSASANRYILENVTDGYLQLYVDVANNTIRGQIVTASGTETWNEAHGLSGSGANQWALIHITWDSSSPSKLYVNGTYKSDGDDAGNGAVSDSANGINIGADKSNGNKFPGIIICRILRRKMGATEITARYNALNTM